MPTHCILVHCLNAFEHIVFYSIAAIDQPVDTVYNVICGDVISLGIGDNIIDRYIIGLVVHNSDRFANRGDQIVFVVKVEEGFIDVPEKRVTRYPVAIEWASNSPDLAGLLQ